MSTRFFALLAVNLNLLPSGRALVCDVGIHPPLRVRGARDREAKLALLRDALQLAGVPAEGEALVHARPLAELDAFCAHERCGALAREQLAQLLDEEARAGAFRRLIPDARLQPEDFQGATDADRLLLRFAKWRAAGRGTAAAAKAAAPL